MARLRAVVGVRRIYIAGPMRGRPEHNFPAFNRAAERFRALGWEVLNPVEIGQQLAANNPEVPGGEYMRADLAAIITCQAIALLPEWDHSTGARCEVAVAITIGLHFYDAGTMQRMPAPARVTICGGYERAAGPVDTFDRLLLEMAEWQTATFGTATPASAAEHLRREAIELCADPSDPEELADVQHLVMAVATCAGHDLLAVTRAKFEKNKRRKWGKPDAHGVVEHVAEGVA